MNNNNSNTKSTTHITTTPNPSPLTPSSSSSSSSLAPPAAAPPPPPPSSSSRSSSSSSTTQACAACKYQRRKCNPDCTLAPYFPAEHQRQFLNAHRLFGVSNILKIIRGLDARSRSEAMKSIIFQSNMRANDPVGGCYRIILDLERQYEHDCHELAIVLHQLALCRQAAAAAAAASAQVQGGQPSNMIVGDADQLNAANADNAIYENDLMAQQQQQQQQQYFDYFYFDGSGSGGGENNIENEEDHINIHINSNATISGNSVNNNNNNNNNNNVGVNGNGANEVEMEAPQSMFSLQAVQPQQVEEDDVKPLIDMFDMTHALAVGEEEVEVGEITSKTADLDLTAGPYHCSIGIQMKKEESNPMEHVQEHDLKGAASLFTLTSRNSSYV